MSLLSDSDLVKRIKRGESDFPYLQMPGFSRQLSTQAIWNVISYIRTFAVDKGPLQGLTPKQRASEFKRKPLVRGRI